VNTSAVADSRAGNTDPSNPTRGATCWAAVTRRWASKRSQPIRSLNACVGDR